MIEENFIKFESRDLYDSHKSEVDPSFIVFISEVGKERIITQNTEYLLVPNNGKEGLILTKYTNGFGWSFSKNVNASGNKNIVSIDPALDFLLVLNKTNVSSTLSVAGIPIEGHELHIIIHNENSSAYTILIPNGENYVNTNPEVDEIVIAPEEFGEINIISDGTKMYIRAIS